MKENVEIHPQVIIRISGGCFNKFNEMNFIYPLNLVNEFILIKESLKILKTKLIEKLFIAIQECQNEKARIILLNIKRDIFNLRTIPSEDINLLKNIISCHDFHDLFTEYKNSIFHLNKKSEEITKAYAEEVCISRKYLTNLASEMNFQNGLLLSSITLFDQIPTYLCFNGSNLNKKLNQIEISTIKYLSRIYTKTSPFSSFTNLFFAEINTHNENTNSHFINLSSKKLDVQSSINLNNDLFKYLRETMFINFEIARYFNINLNPTLKDLDGLILFLTNQNNEEAFQRIEKNEFLERIILIFLKYKKEITFQKLVNVLLEWVEIKDKELIKHIYSLIDIGFLELNIGISGLDPEWDKKLIKKIQKFPQNEFISEIIVMLKSLRENARNFKKYDLKKKKEILCHEHHQYLSVINKLCTSFQNSLEEKVPPTKINQQHIFRKIFKTSIELSPEKVFYEDCYVDSIVNLPKEEITPLIFSLNKLLHSLHFSENLPVEHFKLLCFFQQMYPGAESKDLLTFYEDFYRYVKKLENAPSNEHIKNDEGILNQNVNQFEVINSIKNHSYFKDREIFLENWKKKFIENMDEKLEINEHVVIVTPAIIEKVNEHFRIQQKPLKEHHSYATFLQIFKNGSKYNAVVNGVFLGYGKMFSRFLYLFDKKFYKSIISKNISYTPDDSLLAENTDSSCFNGNIHSPLLNFEICSSGSNNSLPIDKQIKISDLMVRVNDDKSDLILVDKKIGKKVFVLDLGFEGFLRRTPLFQLLLLFTNGKPRNYNIVIDAITETYRNLFKENEIIVTPRIIYENLVLRRKNWYIPKGLACVKNNQETDAEYFTRINEWIRKYNINNEVFIKLNFDETFLGERKSEDGKTTLDDYKPQYINFSNPFLVKLFNKLMAKSLSYIKIEEMLPLSDELLEINSDKHVTEFAIQWEG